VSGIGRRAQDREANFLPVFFVSNVIGSLTNALAEMLRQWRAGPETPESEELLGQIARKEELINGTHREIAELEKQRSILRAKAKRSRSTWWSKNRDAFIVNVAAGVIVSLPFFVLGIVVTLVLQ